MNPPHKEPPGPAQATTIGFCPLCGAKLTVVETRSVEVGPYRTVWRRKRCHKHPGRYATMELPEDLAREVMAED